MGAQITSSPCLSSPTRLRSLLSFPKNYHWSGRYQAVLEAKIGIIPLITLQIISSFLPLLSGLKRVSLVPVLNKSHQNGDVVLTKVITKELWMGEKGVTTGLWSHLLEPCHGTWVLRRSDAGHEEGVLIYRLLTEILKDHGKSNRSFNTLLPRGNVTQRLL